MAPSYTATPSRPADPRKGGSAMWLQSPVELTLGGTSILLIMSNLENQAHSLRCLTSKLLVEVKLSKDLLKEVPGLDKRDGGHENSESPISTRPKTASISPTSTP